MKNISLLLTLAIMIIAMCSSAQEKGTFTDSRDGKTYKTVKIGTQTWMAENLAFKAEKGCYAFNDSLKYVSNYGYLYNWEAAMTVCPKGWHLPGDSAWITLLDYLGGASKAAEKIKNTSGWYYDAKGKDKTNNSSGFTALPGGNLNGDDEYEGVGYRCFWWTSTVYDPGWAWFIQIEHSQAEVTKNALPNKHGFSVRCIKD